MSRKRGLLCRLIGNCRDGSRWGMSRGASTKQYSVNLIRSTAQERHLAKNKDAGRMPDEKLNKFFNILNTMQFAFALI